MHSLRAKGGTIFHYDSDLASGDVIIETGTGEVRVPGAALLELVAKAYVLPSKIRLLEDLGADSDAKIAELKSTDSKDLLLGLT